MPSSPEILHRHRHIGVAEVFLKFKSKHFSKSDRHIRVTGKIIIDLQHIKDRTQPQRFSCRRISAIFVNIVHYLGKSICKQHFFPKAPAKPHDSGSKFLRSNLPLLDLPGNILVFYDRACDQLREKGNIQKHVSIISLCFYFSPIDIDHIGKRLKRIKRNPDGKGDLRCGSYGFPTI